MNDRIAMNAHSLVFKFLNKMDTTTWFRLAICALPGLIAGKLWQLNPEPWLSIVATLLLALGILVYAGWSYGKRKFLGQDEDEEASESVLVSSNDSMEYFELQPAKLHIELIDEMISVCNMTSHEIFDALKLESKLWPEAHLAEVIENTHRRKMAETSIKNLSGS